MATRETLILIVGLICWLGASAGLPSLPAQEKNPDVVGSRPSTMPGYTIKLDTISSGFDGKTCWVAPRAGIVPGKSSDSSPSVVLTMQKLWLKGSDVFFAVNEVSPNETWITAAEWMQGPKGILLPGNQYGSDNSVYAARIVWQTPNHDWDAR